MEKSGRPEKKRLFGLSLLLSMLVADPGRDARARRGRRVRGITQESPNAGGGSAMFILMFLPVVAVFGIMVAGAASVALVFPAAWLGDVLGRRLGGREVWWWVPPAAAVVSLVPVGSVVAAYGGADPATAAAGWFFTTVAITVPALLWRSRRERIFKPVTLWGVAAVVLTAVLGGVGLATGVLKEYRPPALTSADIVGHWSDGQGGKRSPSRRTGASPPWTSTTTSTAGARGRRHGSGRSGGRGHPLFGAGHLDVRDPAGASGRRRWTSPSTHAASTSGTSAARRAGPPSTSTSATRTPGTCTCCGGRTRTRVPDGPRALIHRPAPAPPSPATSSAAAPKLRRLRGSKASAGPLVLHVVRERPVDQRPAGLRELRPPGPGRRRPTGVAPPGRRAPDGRSAWSSPRGDHGVRGQLARRALERFPGPAQRGQDVELPLGQAVAAVDEVQAPGQEQAQSGAAGR